MLVGLLFPPVDTVRYIDVTRKMGVQVRQMATLSHLRVGPLKTESVHPHRQELLEFPGASAGKPCHTKLGSMLPALTGVERSMPNADGGSEGVQGNVTDPRH